MLCRHVQNNQLSGTLDVLQDLPLQDLYFIHAPFIVFCSYILFFFHNLCVYILGGGLCASMIFYCYHVLDGEYLGK